MIELFMLLTWLFVGSFVYYKAELTFNYAMHVRYAVVTPIVESPTKTKLNCFMIPAMSVSGFFSFMFFLTSYQYVLKDDPNKSIFKCLFKIKPNKVYVVAKDPLKELLDTLQGVKK